MTTLPGMIDQIQPIDHIKQSAGARKKAEAH